MEPKISSLYLQASTICPYPQPEQSSPFFSSKIIEDPFEYSLSTYA